MARLVYLHVGAPKTGTTYLQDRLALNRTSLAGHDVHYPIGLHASHFRPALDVIDMPWGGQREDVRGEWDALVRRVRRCRGTAIISHEILAGAKVDQIERAVAKLGGELHVVYSARDLARQLPAEWQEGVKHRRRNSFRRFLTRVQRAPRTNPQLWFWRAQSLPDVLGRWSKGLTPDRVHLVTVPHPGAPRDELWLRYCRAFGIDPSWAPEESDRQNNSLGIAETTLLRKLNARLQRVGIASDEYRRLVRELVVHQTLAQRTNMVRVTLPPEAYPWATEVAAEWIDWVSGSGIDVIGDLADLQPVPLVPGARWHDPDAPKRGVMLDAALDALVAVLLEASSRPDPHEQIAAKLNRAARRLRGQ
ncbi:MAG: hypothetical protein ACRDPI_09340 [Nocardioidaceae bacterium]